MIILDTNVLSALMRETPDTKVITWLDTQSRTSVWTSSVTVLEIRFGLQIMATGKKRSCCRRLLERLLEIIGHRIAAFDHGAAVQGRRSSTDLAQPASNLQNKIRIEISAGS